MSELYIGLMSGTSMDGVDAALVDFSTSKSVVRSIHNAPIAPELRADLMRLNQRGDDELHRAALATNALMRVYAQAVNALLRQTGVAASQVRAIGAHGQTVRHRPQQFDGTGYTIQLAHGALLAQLCRIDVVCDFRSRDVAAGGQGAPLVPLFHRAWFGAAGSDVAVLNIGGISNTSLLFASGDVLGFDCGPGNALMDFWCEQHTGHAFDADGAWAASGQCIKPLLQDLLAEPFFALSPPKSTGRDLFNPAWLRAKLEGHEHQAPQDIQATLLELTVGCIAQSLQEHIGVRQLIVCGGGAKNAALMSRLAERLPVMAVSSSSAYGLEAQDVEAVAFAWLARQCVLRERLDYSRITGARGAHVLGAIYPA